MVVSLREGDLAYNRFVREGCKKTSLRAQLRNRQVG